MIKHYYRIYMIFASAIKKRALDRNHTSAMLGNKAPFGCSSLNLSNIAFKYSVVTKSDQGPPA